MIVYYSCTCTSKINVQATCENIKVYAKNEKISGLKVFLDFKETIKRILRTYNNCKILSTVFSYNYIFKININPNTKELSIIGYLEGDDINFFKRIIESELKWKQLSL